MFNFLLSRALHEGNKLYLEIIRDIHDFLAPDIAYVNKLIHISCKSYIYSKLETGFSKSPLQYLENENLSDLSPEVLASDVLIRMLQLIDSESLNSYKGFYYFWLKNQSLRIKKRLISLELIVDNIKSVLKLFVIKGWIPASVTEVIPVIEKMTVESFARFISIIIKYVDINLPKDSKSKLPQNGNFSDIKQNNPELKDKVVEKKVEMINIEFQALLFEIVDILV